ncbi:MAG: efflux RND transporter periplasmic adaptor subunit [Chloroflexi bacterium]|nr:efflux RND transporter periplasmic adaptor subunit [Chloroflexota bacterium]
MKGRQIVAVLSMLCLIFVSVTACNPFGGSEAESNQQVIEVTRGDLAVTINGIGNIAIAEERQLSFGSVGKVEEVYVEEGDKVSKNDVLAKLDTDALELAVTQAELALTEQQVAVTRAEVALTEKEVAVTEAEVALTEKEVAVTEAQVALETAEYNLFEAKDEYILRDIRSAQADVDEAQRYLDQALRNVEQASDFALEWQQKAVIHAQKRLDTAKDILEAMLAGADPQEVDIKNLELELAQQSLELTQLTLELAEQSLEQARRSEKLAQQSLEQEQRSLVETRQSLALAQKQLSEATLTAPFDGVVARVDVDEGDSVSATTTIAYFVDLTSLELEVEVDEIDIPSVKLGQRAIISIDALPGVELGGEVTFIPPMSREEPGLVLYDVKIGFDVPQDFELRGGMSATADIVIDERSNVLLVPNQTIRLDSQGNSIVMIMANELTEERRVVTGISDGSHTEILSGLDEGEVIVIAVER